MRSTGFQLKSTISIPSAVFIFFWAFYLMTAPPANTASIDSLTMFWVCQSIVDDRDFNILNQSLQAAKEKNDPVWSSNQIFMTTQYALIPSLVGIPFYMVGKGLSRVLNRPLNHDQLYAVTSFSASFISALTCWLLFRFILALRFSSEAAILLTGWYGLGTLAWPFAYYLATEPPTTIGILGAVYAAYQYKVRGRGSWLYLSGLFSGMAIASREISIMILPPLIVYLLVIRSEGEGGTSWLFIMVERLRRLFLYFTGVLPFVALNTWYTFARYGVLTNVDYFGYEGSPFSLFRNPVLFGLYELLLSPGQGLLLFCPILGLLLFSVPAFFSKYKAEFLLFISIFAIHLYVYAKFGGTGVDFGPRYLVPTLPLLMLPLASFLETLSVRSFRIKTLVLGVFCLSVLIQSAPRWGVFAPNRPMIAAAVESLRRNGQEDMLQYIPESFPLAWRPLPTVEMLYQFYLLPHQVRSLRFVVFLVLLGTTLGAGFLLLRQLSLNPSISKIGLSAGSLREWIVKHSRDGLRLVQTHKTAVGIYALLLFILSLSFYGVFRGIWVPLSQFSFRPFGVIEYPPRASDLGVAPPLSGIIEPSGWVLDRAGIRSVEIYIDEVKIADAMYGEPSPDIQRLFPHIFHSDNARYRAQGVDTRLFHNGLHIMLVKASNEKGIKTDVDSRVVFFLNEPQ